MDCLNSFDYNEKFLLRTSANANIAKSMHFLQYDFIIKQLERQTERFVNQTQMKFIVVRSIFTEIDCLLELQLLHLL